MSQEIDSTTAVQDPALNSLTIEAVETTAIRVELPRVYKGSQYQMTHRSTIIVRVHCSGGLVGEAYAGDEDKTLFEIESIINEELSPKLLGMDAMATELCWQTMRPATFDILRDRRLGLVASAALDAALWDAVGKNLGQPLWRLWGGYRNRIQMISIGGYYDSEMSIEEEIEYLRSRELAGIKFKVGGLTPAEDAERFIRARRAAGPDFVMAADANQGWSPAEAVEFAKRVEDHDLRWFEEPCGWQNDRLAMRDVRLKTGAQVCAGQSELSAAACRLLMESGSIDVCNFDSSWSGGPTEWRRAAAVAALCDVQMGHHEEPQVSSHLLCSIPHGTYAECFHPERDPIWWNLIANRPKLERGWMTLSSEPGLGWELDEDYIDAHRVSA
ncbi:mandelate racemase/muconate lactonizing enzyme family protein [Streptomyces sp. NPDC000987]|uniref:mandelate racemase/muconate lactonizing enzyme family protein n=1 Tax=Streptomyces sp. NPDC000987 TaxID=3154374 RepID=UPI00332967A7